MVGTNGTPCWRAAVLVGLLAVFGSAADGARILAVETVAGWSHWNFMSSILRALTDNGHHVTVFTPIVSGDRVNYTEVDLSAELPVKLGLDLRHPVIDLFRNPIRLLWDGVSIGRAYCDVVHANRRLGDILDGGADGFDAVLIEPLWYDCSSALAVRLNASLIYAVPFSMSAYAEYAFLGHVPNPATVSNVQGRHAVPKTFVQRFVNAALSAYALSVLGVKNLWYRLAEPKPYDVHPRIPPSAIFLNTHLVVEAPRPTLANVVPVGGIHLVPNVDVPHDILEFIENSPHGVIYLTFGSVISMSTIPKHIHNAFKEALKQVPQRVLWKYEGQMEDTPENVMTSKWFPQRDILMHPKVKLFISHGGISGVYEAVDAGVPVLGFPLFYDQPRNIDHLVEAGMAISMDLMSVQKDQLLKNVLELLNNDKYMKNAKIASKIFKDRPMSPEQSVVYWTEYVIRHKGAPHLKSPAFNLAWYQYFLLDVIGVVLVSILLAVFIIYKVLKIVFKYFFKNKQQNKVKPE